MDKIKKIKILSAVSIIGTILAITVAFALITRSMVINGSGNVKPALWDIHFKDISEPNTSGGASVITEPTVADKGAKIDNLEVRLPLPNAKVEYTVYIENSGEMNAKIDDIKYPTLTEEESKIFKFSAKYEKDGSPMQVGDTLFKNEVKKVIITIEYLDISDKNLLPKETKTIDIDFKIKYVQDNNSYADEDDQSLLPDGYKECEYIESYTDGQYIDTKITPSLNTKIIAELKATGLQTRNNFLGSRNGAAGADNAFGIVSFSSTNKIGFFKFGKSIQCISYDNEYHTYILSNEESKIDGVSYPMPSGITPTSPMPYIQLFGFNQSVANYYTTTNQMIKSFRVYENDNLIANMIPAVRDSDGAPGMYDTVRTTFYLGMGARLRYKIKE